MKKIVIVRHAIAEDREDWNDLGKPDELRPLTKKGEQLFFLAAKSLRVQIANLDYLFASELTRSVDTAAILHREYLFPQIEIRDELNPDRKVEDVVDLIESLPENSTICLIGHSPQIGKLVSFLCTGEKQSIIKIKKGGACLLHLERYPAKIQWALTQNQLIHFLGQN